MLSLLSMATILVEIPGGLAGKRSMQPAPISDNRVMKSICCILQPSS